MAKRPASEPALRILGAGEWVHPGAVRGGTEGVLRYLSVVCARWVQIQLKAPGGALLFSLR